MDSFAPKMDPNALQGLRAMLALLNQQKVSREVDRLFRASRPLTALGNPSTPSVTTMAATGCTLQTPPSIRNIGPLFSARGGASLHKRRSTVFQGGDSSRRPNRRWCAMWKGQSYDPRRRARGSHRIQHRDDVPRSQNNHLVCVSSPSAPENSNVSKIFPYLQAPIRQHWLKWCYSTVGDNSQNSSPWNNLRACYKKTAVVFWVIPCIDYLV